MEASLDMENYFEDLSKKTSVVYGIAKNARVKGLDPVDDVEVPLAQNMAERVEGLISVVAPQIIGKGIANRIIELEKKFGKLNWRVAFSIALDVAEEKFCKFKDQKEAIEVGIRVGFAYVTSGVVSSPLEGFLSIEIKKTRNGEDYFSLNYAGPVRSAGGTAAAVSVLLADFLRVKLGFSKYDATEEEVRRAVTELYDYHERVTNLQYLPSEEEIDFFVRNIPVQIDGPPTEEREVSNYKDLSRIGTNRIRNGFCLVLGECLIQKAPKYWKQISTWSDEFEMKDWSFLEKFVKLQKKAKAKGAKEKDSGEIVKPDYTFIKDIVAGRPVLTYPMEKGGFRLRYGRSRISGLSSLSIHPATMHVLSGYIGTGTQLKYERPGKSTAVAPCDSIEGPIVKLKNGNVRFLDNADEAKRYKEEVEEILFLGDILVNYGEFFNRAHVLLPAGYCEEWWAKELEKIIDFKEVHDAGFSEPFFRGLLNDPIKTKVSAKDSIKIAKHFGVPLHPRYTYHWKDISMKDMLALFSWLNRASIEKSPYKMILPLRYEVEGIKLKRVLELLGVPHQVASNENVVVLDDWAEAFMVSLGFYDNELELSSLIEKVEGNEDVLGFINEISEVEIRDKSGFCIGARMGRPEKAKMRKLTGSPHVLFPVGDEGGRLRSFQSSLGMGKVTADFPLYYCDNCKRDLVYPRCGYCDGKARLRFYCRDCDKVLDDKCVKHQSVSYNTREVDIEDYFNLAKQKLKLEELPPLIKGVRGTSNEMHLPEHLVKGILRAMHDLYVNKDGTIRYDMTEMPITHFKAKEIGINIERVKQLGYNKDIYGKELENEDQLLEIKPQDIILPRCIGSKEEGADIVFFRVANYLDALLKEHYGLQPFYKLKSKHDLVGHLVVGLAPHTSSGIIGRIIGFSDTQGCYAHPMWHAAMRRDCVHPKTKFVYYDLDKKEIFYEEIGGFVERLVKDGAKTKRIDSVGTLSVENTKNILVTGIDPITRNLVFKKVKCFIKGPLNNKWVKVTTATNREFVMTETHKFMHIDENKKFSFKDAKYAEVDDKIPVLDKFNLDFDIKDSFNLVELFINNLDEKDKKNIRFLNCEEFFRKVTNKNKKEILSLLRINKERLYYLPKYLTLFELEKLIDAGLINYENLPKEAHLRYRSEHKLPMSFNISKELLNLLGYYAAEGYSRQNKSVSQISFRIFRKELQDRVVSLIKSVFNMQPNLGEGNSKITICSKLVYLLFVKCFKTGSNAYSKRVPNFIFSLPEDFIADYLSGYVDGDGSIVPQRNFIILYSVNRSLLDDFALLCSRFGLIARYFRTKERLPGKKVLEIYKSLNKKPKKHILNHLIFSGVDAYKLKSILKLNNSAKADKLDLIRESKQRRLNYNGKRIVLETASDYFIDYVKKIELVEDSRNSYCVEIDWKSQEDKNILWGEQIINTRCEGDETSCMLLLDLLINFSRKYLPAHRGSTQDACLVLTSKIIPSEVDEMVLDLDVAWKYPLEFYEAAMKFKSPWEFEIERLGKRLGTEKQYSDFGFTHEVSNLNQGILCSAYKSLPTMQEKVFGQMDLAHKIRAVNEADVARLVIERHFIRDIRGNLRKFSIQQFRCVDCNEKFRRPPLIGKCTRCGGKIIFTISQGSIMKYLLPSLELAKKYNLPNYLKQTLDITKKRIDSVFGKEDEQQQGLTTWFK